MTLLKDFDAFRKAHRPHSMTHEGYTWDYLVSGKGKNTMVIFHGGRTSSDTTWEYIEAFSSSYRVIAPTLPEGIQTMQETVEGLAALFNKEEVDCADLLGFSEGGMIAQCFIRAHPDLVRHMILFVTMGPSKGFIPRFARRLFLLQWTPAFLVRSISKRFIRKQILAEKGPRKQLEFWAYIFASLIDAGRISKAGIIASGMVLLDYFRNYSFAPDDLKDHAGRVMIFEGDRDAIVDAETRRELKSLYPRARVVCIENSGHFGFGLLQAKPLVRQMKEFLSKR